MREYVMNLHLFEDGAQGGDSSQNTGSSKNNTTFTYEQLNEIATSRAERAERSALRNYFQQQGMSEEEAAAAFTQFKEQRAKNQPNVSEIEKERDEARKELEQYKNTAFLQKRGVRQEDLDYVMFKVAQLIDDKTDFSKAADKFLKENPRYAGTAQVYRVSGSTSNSSSDGATSKNASINDTIRRIARR